MNNNAFVYSLTGNTESGSIEFGTARCSDKVNTKNLMLDINFLNCHFNDNG
jgi:hypothetical protein